jgi:AGZA family xanthine/uracil permease-like MFS transporter
LALDNLIQVLLVLTLCSGVLGFSPELVFGRMLPGISASLVVGNVYYAWQARRLASRAGRTDVCALPYGINTVSLIGFVFLVMLPAKVAAENAGATGREASEIAFRAGVVAALGAGVIEAGGAWAAVWLRRWTPRAAMLSTLAGIAVTFIAAGFLFRTFAVPLVAFAPLGIVLLTYFGRVRFPGGMPGGLVAVGLGTGLAWLTGLAPTNHASVSESVRELGLRLPSPTLGAIASGLSMGLPMSSLAVIVPMGLFGIVGSLQNLESAAAAGDDFPTVPSLVANGIGTIVGACLGSPFPTTIYIGHPGWKALGARSAYSILNAVFFTFLGLTGAAALVGTLVPIEAGMAIVLWIGIVMVAQAFQATPREHAPAVAIGLLPGIAAWGALMMKAGLRAAGMGGAGHPIGPSIVNVLGRADVAAHGAFALEQGFLLTSTIWAALTVEIIERRFTRAAGWALTGSILSGVGLIHAYRFTPSDTVANVAFGNAWQFSLGYALLAILILLARWAREDVIPEH